MEHCNFENHLKLVLFSFHVVSMEENKEDFLFWYKCACFCYSCKFSQKHSDLSCLPNVGDVMWVIKNSWEALNCGGHAKCALVDVVLSAFSFFYFSK